MRAVSVVVTVTMLCLILEPNGATAADARPSAKAAAAGRPAPRSADEQYAAALQRLKTLAKAARSAPPASHAAAVQAVRDAAQALRAVDTAVDRSFAETGRLLEERRIAEEIKDRHRAAEGAFRQQRQALNAALDALTAAARAGSATAVARALQDLDVFLAKNDPARHQKKLDPNKLPWRVADRTKRKPALSTETFRSSTTPTLTGSTGLTATLGVQSVLPPTAPEYLAETDAAQLTPAIRQLAASLGGNPVRIYEWVRDNVDYLPSFGSIQGSDVTLSKRRGNAFDTASLLIALLRASGIPARYVYGTIEVPAAAAQDWVGGVATPSAAQQLWGQGGVPNTALVSGGRITHLQLEHVWVEAWVDFVPSRGQVNVQGDTWVPLDASYKQHTESAGLAAEANVPLDPTAMQQAFLDGAVVNESEGWIQHPNTLAVQTAGETYLRNVNGAIHQAKPNATNADVLGSRTIVRDERTLLAASLPYRTVATGARYADLPSGLTHRFRYTVYASDLDRAMGEPLFSFEDALPRLAGRKVTILYAPASQADADLIASYLPRPHADGSPLTAEDFAAAQLPAYLIRLRPELRVDGVLRASGAAITMGTQLPATGAFTAMDLSSGWDQTEDLLTAGQVTAIGLDLQGIDPHQLDEVRARMATAKADLDRSNLGNRTGEQVAGDLVTAMVWSYFAAVHLGERAARTKSAVIDVPGLSYGLGHVDLEVTASFGFAQTAQTSGVVLDIGHLRAIRWSKDADVSRWVRYNRIMGQNASALEHQIPEVLFVRSNAPGEAVSAVKLLAKAAAAGQRIYTLTASNVESALSRLRLSAAVVADIRAAVAAGKEVTAHEQELTIDGWTGAGYVVVDPATGSGAYMISGGANGGKLLLTAGGFLFGLFNALAFGALLATLATPVAGAVAAFIVAAVLLEFIIFAISSVVAALTDDNTYLCYASGFLNGFFLGLPSLGQVWMDKLVNLFQWGVAGNSIWQCIL